MLLNMPERREYLLQGTVIYGDDFQAEEGYISIRDGIIKEFGREHIKADLEGIICPRFVNAHVHLGDSFFKDPPFMPLSELVGPGGYKARMLERSPRERVIEGMRRSLELMQSSGTYAFADFREGGADGVAMLHEALQDMPVLARILGRPGPGRTEIPPSCWGLGISSTRDLPREIIEAAVAQARQNGQMIGIHAGEAGRDDIESALSLQPDFLVHMNRAEDSDLMGVASRGIPVVVCPRSNLMTGVGLPRIAEMVRHGIDLAAGTDNVMLSSPDMFEEMHLLANALLHDDRQVFKMCTLNGAKITGLDQRLGSIREGKEGRVMVLDKNSNNLWGSMNPLSSIVRRASRSDIMAIL
jgi:cytosine/adenosine deaminase-related metal-dependent hydrolase